MTLPIAYFMEGEEVLKRLKDFILTNRAPIVQSLLGQGRPKMP